MNAISYVRIRIYMYLHPLPSWWHPGIIFLPSMAVINHPGIILLAPYGINQPSWYHPAQLYGSHQKSVFFPESRLAMSSHAATILAVRMVPS